jgi:hypothetical protein
MDREAQIQVIEEDLDALQGMPSTATSQLAVP